MYKLVFFSCLIMIGCNTVEDEKKDLNIEKESEQLQINSPYGDHQLFWHWEDKFSIEESLMLQKWIIEVTKATEVTLGNYPFDIHYYFHKSDGNEPVPFGHTAHVKHMAVHFHVNPSFNYQAFIDDWTAPHEISHLSIPFLGKKQRWFSEGYATFLSRQIMMDMGYFTQSEFDSLYLAKIINTKEVYDSKTDSFVQTANDLFKSHNCGAIYSGGASYFYTMDHYLREKHNIRFSDLVRDYQKCCRITDKSIDDVIASFDDMIKDSVFTALMDDYRHLPAVKLMNKF